MNTDAPALLSPVVSRYQITEIWDVDDLAAFLKCSKRSVYELTRRRGQRHEIPLPVLRLPCGMRFRRADIEQWIQACVDAATQQGQVA